MDLEKASAYHLAALRTDNRSPGTINNYATAQRLFIGWLLASRREPPTLADLNLANARAFLDWLRVEHTSTRWGGATVGHGPSNVRWYARVLKVWASFLDQEELLPKGDPLARLTLPKAPKVLVQAFSREQVELMTALCASTALPLRNTAILLLLSDTGLRVAELCGLCLNDVELATAHHQGRAKVLGKGSQERYVYFGAKTSYALTKYLTLERPDAPAQPWLFLGRGSTQLTDRAVQALVKPLGKQAGITGIRVSPHVFRHTWATQYLKAHPGQVLQVQALLGHSSLEMTRRYAKVAEHDLAESYQSLVDGWSVRVPRKASELVERREAPAPPSSAALLVLSRKRRRAS